MYLMILGVLFVLFCVENSVEGCSGQINLIATSSYQYFTSPSYPSLYSSNLSCSWLITAASIYQIVELEFRDSVIEDSGMCVNDRILVYDGQSATIGTHLLTFCGIRQPSLHSTSRRIYVQFFTNSLLEYKGFKARYFQKEVASQTLSFDALVTIIAVVTFVLIALIILVGCVHKKMSKKVINKISKLSIDYAADNKIVPLGKIDSYPILPTKPIGVPTKAKPDKKRGKNTVVTVAELDQDYPVLPTKPVGRTANIPVSKRHNASRDIEDIPILPSTSKGRDEVAKKSREGRFINRREKEPMNIANRRSSKGEGSPQREGKSPQREGKSPPTRARGPSPPTRARGPSPPTRARGPSPPRVKVRR